MQLSVFKIMIKVRLPTQISILQDTLVNFLGHNTCFLNEVPTQQEISFLGGEILGEGGGNDLHNIAPPPLNRKPW